MNVYMYQAALWCEPCTLGIMATLTTPDGYAEYDWDSDSYPVGPYAGDMMESDSPDHCDECNVHLENPLTPDGYRYIVWESINAEWDAFYGIEREA